MTNARWQNTQSRVLRAYISVTAPTREQRRLVSFVIFVYVPTFLEIRQKNLLVEGPRHFLAMLQRIRAHCTNLEVDQLRAVIQFNAYFCQYEVVMTSLIGSPDPNERQEGYNLISKLRKKERMTKRKTIRKVKNPLVNLHASKLSEMVDLSKAKSSSPLLSKYTDEELSNFVKEPCSVNLPCSTTAVERGVKMTTEAATMVAGAWKQNTLTWNRVAARERNVKRFRKNDWLI